MNYILSCLGLSTLSQWKQFEFVPIFHQGYMQSIAFKTCTYVNAFIFDMWLLFNGSQRDYKQKLLEWIQLRQKFQKLSWEI